MSRLLVLITLILQSAGNSEQLEGYFNQCIEIMEQNSQNPAFLYRTGMFFVNCFSYIEEAKTHSAFAKIILKSKFFQSAF